MKKIISLILPFVLIIGFSNSASGQKADMTGSWKLDRSKIPATGSFPVLVQIDIKIVGDSLLTQRTYDLGDGQQYPFTENLTLDGKEIQLIVYEMPRKVRATWSEQDGTINLESVTTANGQNGTSDFKSKETWSLDKINNILTINFRNTAYDGELNGAFIFNKSVQTN